MSEDTDKPNDDTINSLIDQLKDTSSMVKQVNDSEDEFTLNKEDLEDFVINNAGKIINESLSTIEHYKEYVTAAPNAEDISAYADLIRATSTAVESLNKIIVQDKRSATSEKVKMIDMEGKKQLQDSEEANYLLRGTRTEMLEELMKKADAIDITKPTKKISDGSADV